MKSFFLNLVALFIFCTGWAQVDPSRYGDEISPANLKDQLTILASDALEGRATGSRGQRMAAAFIASHFQEIGLQGPVNGSYFQPVELFSTRQEKVVLKIGDEIVDNELFVYTGMADSQGDKNTSVIFAGQGGDADLAQLGVSGKSVLIWLPSLGSMSGLRSTAERLRAGGADQVFIVLGLSGDDYKGLSFQMRSFVSGGGLSLAPPRNKGVFFINPSVAEKMFKMTYAKLVEVAKNEKRAELLKKMKPCAVTYRTQMSVKTVKTDNVLGFLEGTDKKDEVIVITSHYDHIGKKSEGTGDLINNGADDDGSGTVSVLELARVFAKARAEGNGPRRSILFMTVTAEEVGLLGSQCYVEHPVFPLEKTVVNLNMDMVGRWDAEHKGKSDYVYVIGSDKLSSELHEINERNNKLRTHLAFDYTYNDENHPTNLYKRSDHWNFAKNGIPIIFYFDGIHEDYHQPSDEVSKIDFDLMAKRAKAMFFNAWEIANRENRLAVDKK